MAPKLTEIVPLMERGWRLRWALADNPNDFVEINALIEEQPQPHVEYQYRRPSHDQPTREAHLHRVAQTLCTLLTRASASASSLPHVPKAVENNGFEPGRPQRDQLRIWLEGGCDRACEFCVVSLNPIGNRHSLPVNNAGRLAEIRQRLRDRAGSAETTRIDWNGKDCLLAPGFDEALRLAHDLGYRDMTVQSPGSRLADPKFVDFLVHHSVTEVRLTAHGKDPEIFDAVAGREGAYDLFWQAIEHLRSVDVSLFLAVPIVRKTVDTLAEHVEQLCELGSEITCFHWYADPELEHEFANLGTTYDRSVEQLQLLSKRIPARRVTVSGIPQCAMPSHLWEHFLCQYGTRHTRLLDYEPLPECEACPARDRCRGAASVYLKHFGRWLD